MERYEERFNDYQEPHRNPQAGNFPGDHHHFRPEHQSYHQHHHQHQFERYSDQQRPNDEQHDAFWSANGGGHNFGRKRGFPHSGRGASPDHTDGNNVVKLYAAPVPRTATEAEIRSLFEVHGNIVEVVLPKDKKNGERQGYCFVKYATIEGAARAITNLHNQHTFPGENTTVKIRYADGERDRIGPLIPNKLYVGCLNKQATRKEIEEIFSPYGYIEDIYIVRDELRENRGCGFVQFYCREMALAAIKGLNGVFTMRGCDQPLIVRFANPKRPRAGEPRGNYAPNGQNYCSYAQELAVRSGPNLSDPMVGPVLPCASYPLSANSLQQAAPHWANVGGASSNVTQHSHPPVQPLSHSTQMPLQIQTPWESSQSSHQSGSGMQKNLPLVQPASQNLGQQQNSHVSKLESPQTGTSQTTSVTSATPATPQNLEMVATPDCDWSEHTCPDGYKYYYNCVTLESRWDKPEEFTLFEKQFQKQKQMQNPSEKLHSALPIHSMEQGSQNQEVQLQSCLMHPKHQVQQSSISTLELDHVQVKSEISTIVVPTCV